jgi:hypothetical protein
VTAAFVIACLALSLSTAGFVAHVIQSYREPARRRTMIRLCEVAVAIDEALHKGQVPAELQQELCNAADDYLAGEELSRNRPSSITPAPAPDQVSHVEHRSTWDDLRESRSES